jgi:hypothetical protein
MELFLFFKLWKIQQIWGYVGGVETGLKQEIDKVDLNFIKKLINGLHIDNFFV